jgi:hypothetical protein
MREFQSTQALKTKSAGYFSGNSQGTSGKSGNIPSNVALMTWSGMRDSFAQCSRPEPKARTEAWRSRQNSFRLLGLLQSQVATLGDISPEGLVFSKACLGKKIGF